MSQPPKQFNRPFVSPRRVLALVLAVVVFFILLTSVLGLAGKYIGVRKHIAALRREQETAALKKADLEAKNAYLATPEGAEKELRQKYNLVRPGEGVVVITSPIEPQEAPQRSMVGRFWDSILRGLGLRK